MTPISLFDTVEWSPATNEQIALTIEDRSYDPSYVDARLIENRVRRPDIPTAGNNIVVKALVALRKASGVRAGARIRLTKRIPAEAGLGGASSDAAAALSAANLGWDLQWPVSRLMELASDLGSDVPFFLQPTAAICRGRGELIESLPMRTSLHLVVVKPPIGLSTPAVFRACTVPRKARSATPIIEALIRGNVRDIATAMHNRLQQASQSLTEWIGRLANEFAAVDCAGHQMSGSGSSYFGVFRSRRQALRAACLIRARRVGSVFVVRTLRGVRTVRS